METQTRLSRHNKFISAENIVGIFSVSSDDSYDCYTHFVDNSFKRASSIFLHTVKWFQGSLCNNNNLTSVLYLHTFE